jgi:hypothetical protein
MAEPIHLELLADFFNRIGHEQTKRTATNLTIGGLAESFFLSQSLPSDRHGPE